MPRVLVPLAQGCEELEAVTIIDLLRRAEIDVVTVGLESGDTPAPVTASRGTVLIPDRTLDAVREENFDMIVLPGGLPGADHLDRDPRLRAMLVRHAASGRYTAAICAAPKVLANAGLLDGRTATAYPGALAVGDYPQVRFTDAPVAVDGTVVTGRGPGTAMDFALRLIGLLAGEERRQAVEAALVRAT